MKVCSSCKAEKNLTEFYKRLNNLQAICKVCHKSYMRIYYLNNKEELKKQHADYYSKNKDIRLIQFKEYGISNRKEINKRMKEYYHTQKNINQLFILSKRIRTLIWAAFSKKKVIKADKTELIIGCSIIELHIHLKKTWDKNYPGRDLIMNQIHIDHIIPLSSASSKEELIKLNHYTNLQLLLAQDNLKKSDKGYIRTGSK